MTDNRFSQDRDGRFFGREDWRFLVAGSDRRFPSPGVDTRFSGDLPWGFLPTWIFDPSDEAVWYDPSDLSTMFQDSAGNTPVTAAGDPVGRIEDKSGNGHHAVQATGSKRPTYQTSGGLHWLAFDGVSDRLASAYGTTFENITRCVAFRSAAAGFVVDDNDNSNRAALYDMGTGTLRWAVNGGGSSNQIDATGWANDADHVAIAAADDSNALSLSGTGNSASGSSLDVTNISGVSLGAAGGDSNYLNGRIFGFVDINRMLTQAETTALTAYLKSISGLS